MSKLPWSQSGGIGPQDGGESRLDARRVIDFLDAATLPLDRFLELHSAPVLIHLEILPKDRTEPDTASGEGPVPMVPLELGMLPKPRMSTVRAHVLKKDRTRFGEAIWLGRWPKCDIILDVPTVSRLHAFVTLEPTGAWITDGGSKNGTFVNGVPLGRGETVPLADDATIVLGRFPVRFYRPEAFYRALQSILLRMS